MDNETYTYLLKAIREHSGMELASIREAGEHGADAGWPGFTYTMDGADFTRAHRDVIWSLLRDEADSYGCNTVLAFIGGWASAEIADNPDSFDCLLAWYALESVGRQLADRSYEKERR